MSGATVITFSSRLDRCRARIREAHELTKKSHAEWVAGSLEVAAALLDARENMVESVAFTDWLRQSGLDFLSRTERIALMKLGEKRAEACRVMTTSTTRSYAAIWQEHFVAKKPEPRKTDVKKAGRAVSMARAELLRAAKLGEVTVKRIKGTSLDSAKEMDELVVLNRGAAPGELTPQVKQLVAAAEAGQEVSALSLASKSGARSKPALVATWTKRMVHAWECATYDERSQFIDWLMEKLGGKR